MDTEIAFYFSFVSGQLVSHRHRRHPFAFEMHLAISGQGRVLCYTNLSHSQLVNYSSLFSGLMLYIMTLYLPPSINLAHVGLREQVSNYTYCATSGRSHFPNNSRVMT